MTVKLTVLYTKPDDPDAFDKHYFEVHVPMVERYPGVERLEIARVSGGPGGMESPWHLVTEIYFADHEAMNTALRSEAARESGKDFAATAPPGSSMAVSELVDLSQS